MSKLLDEISGLPETASRLAGGNSTSSSLAPSCRAAFTDSCACLMASGYDLGKACNLQMSTESSQQHPLHLTFSI